MSGYKVETHPVTRIERKTRIAPNVTLTSWMHAPTRMHALPTPQDRFVSLLTAWSRSTDSTFVELRRLPFSFERATGAHDRAVMSGAVVPVE